jgi:lipoprotein LprG
VLLAGLAAACSDDPDPSTFPAGATLVQEAATAMGEITSVHLLVDIDPPLGSPPISRADLDLTDAGETAGEVEAVIGALITVRIVTLADGKSFLELPGQGWIESGLLAETYDTTAILDPDRGIAKLLSTATNATTTGSEAVGGIDAWKVSVTLDSDVVEALVPASLPDQGLTGTVWLDKTSKRMIKTVLNAPATNASPEATISLTLTNFNVPVSVSAPI